MATRKKTTRRAAPRKMRARQRQRRQPESLRLRSLGDCVLTTPAIALLKQARPDLELAVVVEERFAPIFRS